MGSTHSRDFESERDAFKERFEANPRADPDVSVDDFERCATVGTGTFGRVILVKDKKDKKPYALKVLKKSEVVRLRQVEHTLSEKRILASVDFPFIVRLFHHFVDSVNLYMALEFVPGGELFTHLRKSGRFGEAKARFYTTQVVMAIAYLHHLKIAYRDIKPENLLIDAHGYLKLTDFGFAKRISHQTWTMCGTPEYLAPEVILGRGYAFTVDWWSLGVLVFEMCAGYAPFTGRTQIEIYEGIVTGAFKNPRHFSSNLRDFIKSLLQTDLTRRFGCMKRGVSDIKDHKWFTSAAVDWDAIFERRVAAPYLPRVPAEDDHHNYEDYDEEPIVDNPLAVDKYRVLFVEF